MRMRRILSLLLVCLVVAVTTASAAVSSYSVAASVTVVTLLDRVGTRQGATIHNDGTAILYINLGFNASTTNFTARLTSQGYYEVPFGYQGPITGIWDAANGSARITDIY